MAQCGSNFSATPDRGNAINMADRSSIKLVTVPLLLKGADYFLLLHVFRVDHSDPESTADSLEEFLLHVPSASMLIEAEENLQLNFFTASGCEFLTGTLGSVFLESLQQRQETVKYFHCTDAIIF